LDETDMNALSYFIAYAMAAYYTRWFQVTYGFEEGLGELIGTCHCDGASRCSITRYILSEIMLLELGVQVTRASTLSFAGVLEVAQCSLKSFKIQIYSFISATTASTRQLAPVYHRSRSQYRVHLEILVETQRRPLSPSSRS